MTENTEGNAGGPNLDVGEPPNPPGEQPECVDNDGNGYGKNCYLGPDCDHDNKNFTVYCPPCDMQTVKGWKCFREGAVETWYEGDPGIAGIGESQVGQRYCQEGGWTECKGQVTPMPEECDGKDNDCDGDTDEGPPPLRELCPLLRHTEATPGFTQSIRVDQRQLQRRRAER